MKKNIIFIISLFIALSGSLSLARATEMKLQQIKSSKEDTHEFSNLEQQLRDDFRLFLEELYKERERGKKSTDIIVQNVNKVLADTTTLIAESRKELTSMSYSESRNLLVASIFLWISITIFIVMNLVFANNLKKELYFLRNGLLRSEIKENMINLSNQLSNLNEKLELINNNMEK